MATDELPGAKGSGSKRTGGPRVSWGALIVLLGLAAFGVVSVVQWVLGALLGVVKIAIVVAVVLAIVSLVARGIGDDD